MQDVAAGRSAKNAVFVLQADHVHIVEIEELCRSFIRTQIVLRKRPSNPRWIRIAFICIVHRERQQSGTSVLRGNCTAQVRGESGYSTLTWEIVSDHGDPAGQFGMRRWCRRSARWRGSAADYFQLSDRGSNFTG